MSSFRLIGNSEKWLIKKPVHNRRAHTKSRSGCRPCKSARLKCDEGKPACQRCSIRRLQCHYDEHLSKIRHETPSVLNRSLEPFIHCKTDAELWHHFTNCTWATLADPRVNIVVIQSISLAFQAEYLKQAVLALAATHRRSLGAVDGVDNLVARHLWKAIALFRSQLTQPPSASTMDAVLLTSFILSTQNFFLDRPQSSGSRSTEFSEELGWLNLLSGWRPLLFQHRNWLSTSVWAKTMQKTPSPHGIALQSSARPQKSIAISIPNSWRAVFCISENEDLANNPYLSALNMLAALMGRDDSKWSLTELMTFAHTLDPRLLALVGQRDPLAICIIAMWLGCLCQVDLWWIADRAQYECYAACAYLEAHTCSTQRLPLGQTARSCGYRLNKPRLEGE